jgi:hypothetical protein
VKRVNWMKLRPCPKLLAERESEIWRAVHSYIFLEFIFFKLYISHASNFLK